MTSDTPELQSRVIEVVAQVPFVNYRARWICESCMSPAIISLEQIGPDGQWHSLKMLYVDGSGEVKSD